MSFAFHRTSRVSLALALSLCALAAHAQTDVAALSPNALQQIAAVKQMKADLTPAERKLATPLLVSARLYAGKSVPVVPEGVREGLQTDMLSRIKVTIAAPVSDALLGAITNSGGAVVSASAKWKRITAYVHPTQLTALSAWPGVQNIGVALPVITNTGSVLSEGDHAHLADLVRSTYGATGAGLKIGVLSDSVNNTNSKIPHLANSISKGDLAADTTVLPGQEGTGLGEGTAMMELIHDLAPDAKLFFATGNPTEEQMAQNILDLRGTYGCDIIVDDLTYPTEAAFQPGPIEQAVGTVVGNGALYFSSAGNSGSTVKGNATVWEGDYVDGGAVTIGGTNVAAFTLSHVAKFGTQTFLSTGNGNTGPILLQWSDPFNLGVNDYDLYLTSSDGKSLITYSINDQVNAGLPPLEYVYASSNRRLYVDRYSGNARYLRVYSYGPTFTPTTKNRILGHNGAASAYSVAAVGAYTTANQGKIFTGRPNNPAEGFTSEGGRKLFFTANNVPLTPGNYSSTGGVDLAKPDIAAADGANTSLPSPFHPFFGTSAAAPHAAAIAALVKTYKTPPGGLNGVTVDGGRLSASEMFTLLTRTALDVESVGFDNLTGYGIVMPGRVIEYLNKFYSTTGTAAQNITDNTASVVWATNLAATGEVRYGTTPALGNTVAQVGAPSLNHSVVLTGLTPGTQYYFQVRTQTPTGSIGGTSPVRTFATTGVVGTPSVQLGGLTLTRDLNTNQIVATVTLRDSGTGIATNVRVTSATLANVATITSLPATVPNIAVGGTQTATVRFAPLAPGLVTTLKIAGTYTRGTFTCSARVTVPGGAP